MHKIAIGYQKPNDHHKELFSEHSMIFAKKEICMPDHTFNIIHRSFVSSKCRPLNSYLTKFITHNTVSYEFL